MKTINITSDIGIIINKCLNCSGLAFLLLLALFVLAAGCATLSGRDPLEGWKDLGSALEIGCPFNQTIENDYKTFIQNLPKYELRSVFPEHIEFYEKADGRRAVKITTLGKGFIGEIWWEHILIYDSKDKRIKTIKHKDGRSLS